MLSAQVNALSSQGAPPEEISSALNIPVEAVKYHQAREQNTDFDDESCREFAAIIKQIATAGDNERNRLTAATFGYEVGRGLKKRMGDAPNVNITQLNQLIHQANNFINNVVPDCEPGPTRALEEAPRVGGHEQAPRLPYGWEYE